jgi:hypothetical protein
MIGKIVSGLAGRSVARTIGGTAAGPAGALIGAALPVLIPTLARRLGPIGMIGVAVGGALFTRWLERRSERQKAVAGLPPRSPEALLGGPDSPDALEGELRAKANAMVRKRGAAPAQ